MNSNLVEKAVLNTLHYFAANNSPLTFDELFIYTNTSEIRSNIKKEAFSEALNKLVTDQQVAKYGTDVEYYSLADYQFERIKPELSEVLFDKSFLILLAVINPIFVPQAEKTLPHFYAIVKDNTLNASRFLINRKLKHLKCEQYKLTILEEKDTPFLISVKNLDTAYFLISLQPLINDLKFYEHFIYKNLWIFSYLGNYPLDKINLSYRSSYKVEPAGFSITFLNKILKIY